MGLGTKPQTAWLLFETQNREKWKADSHQKWNLDLTQAWASSTTELWQHDNCRPSQSSLYTGLGHTPGSHSVTFHLWEKLESLIIIIPEQHDTTEAALMSRCTFRKAIWSAKVHYVRCALCKLFIPYDNSCVQQNWTSKMCVSLCRYAHTHTHTHTQRKRLNKVLSVRCQQNNLIKSASKTSDGKLVEFH